MRTILAITFLVFVGLLVTMGPLFAFFISVLVGLVCLSLAAGWEEARAGRSVQPVNLIRRIAQDRTHRMALMDFSTDWDTGRFSREWALTHWELNQWGLLPPTPEVRSEIMIQINQTGDQRDQE